MQRIWRRWIDRLRSRKTRASLVRRYRQVWPALSVLFKREWYLEQNPDVRVSGADPLIHFLLIGGNEGRDPHPLFDSDWYLEQNQDVREAGINPLIHYLTIGWRENRDPSVLFKLKAFIGACPEAGTATLDPLCYYLSNWRECGHKLPVPVFRWQWYMKQYPSIKDWKVDPLTHYLTIGAVEGRDPNPLFESEWYARRNPDVAAQHENPLIHYLRRGAAEGRPANSLIKGRWYIENIDEFGVPLRDGLAWFPARQDVPAVSPADHNGFSVVADFSTDERNSFAKFCSDRALFGRDADLIAVMSWEKSSRIDVTSTQSGIRLFEAPREAFREAIINASSRRKHLLFVHSGAFPRLRDVQQLLRALDADPMIGFAVPRFSVLGTSSIVPLLEPDSIQTIKAYDEGIRPHLSKLQLTPEFIAPCVLARESLVSNIPDFSEHFDSVYGALLATMTWSRRVGYRTIIANDAVVKLEESEQAYPKLSVEESRKLIDFFPDSIGARTRFGKLASHRAEALLGRARSNTPHVRNTLLLDCSGMRPIHNGTSESMIGIINGFEEMAADWSVDILVPSDADDFHGMRGRSAKLNVINELGVATYTAAIRLSQPWSMTDIAYLHCRARFILFFFLDTISWDTSYSTPDSVERVWRFAAAYSDGLLYDSLFTKNRFNFRFPTRSSVKQIVTYLSFDSDEYNDGRKRAGNNNHILIIGNDHDHKAIEQALAVLPATFPDEQFVVLGSGMVGHSNVRPVKSGFLTEGHIVRLFVDARLVIYPSFYEGFGLPIIKALSYDLDVIARRSELLFEIASNCASNGRIVPFDDTASLIGAVQKCLTCSPVESLPLGGAKAKQFRPIRWRDVAARIIGAVEEVSGDGASGVYDDREAAFRLFDPATLCTSK